MRYPNKFRSESFGDERLVSLIRLFHSGQPTKSPVEMEASVTFFLALDGNPKNGLQRPVVDFPRPTDLHFDDEFVFDSHSNQLFRRNTPISGDEFVKFVLDQHLMVLRFFPGLVRRLKLLRRAIWTQAIYIVYRSLDWTGYLLFGTRHSISIEKHRFHVSSLDQPKERTEKTDTTPRKLSVMSIEADPWALATFCGIHLLAYAVLSYLQISPPVLARIFKSNALSGIYLVFAIVCYDVLLRNLLDAGRKRLFRLYESISFSVFRL